MKEKRRRKWCVVRRFIAYILYIFLVWSSEPWHWIMQHYFYRSDQSFGLTMTYCLRYNHISCTRCSRASSTMAVKQREIEKAFEMVVYPLTAKLINLNFHPLEVVSRWRDPQLWVSENYSDLTNWRSTVFKYCWLLSHFIFNMLKKWYLMCW